MSAEDVGQLPEEQNNNINIQDENYPTHNIRYHDEGEQNYQQ